MTEYLSKPTISSIFNKCTHNHLAHYILKNKWDDYLRMFFHYLCEVKILIVILSFYLAALSCLPCADEVTALKDSPSKYVSLSEHNHSHEKHVDLCSPFCICNCCGAQVFSLSEIKIFEFPHEFPLIVKLQPVYRSSLTAFFSGSIWQPPQIV